MRNKKLSNTRKISVSLLSILFCVLSFSKVFSADINISSIEDWNGGSLSGTRPVSSGVGIELETGGSWGALTWKTPDKVLSVGAAFTSDGSNIYVVRGLGDVKAAPGVHILVQIFNILMGIYMHCLVDINRLLLGILL